jgi:ketosteroid isomerase-like protein
MSGNTDLVAKGYQAFAAGDVDTVLAMIDPSITVWQTDELPWGGSYEGIEGFMEFFGKLLGTITSSVEPAQIFEAGEHVVQVGRTRGTVNATGAAFDVAEVHVWELRDGKAVSLRSYIDTPAMLAALDA